MSVEQTASVFRRDPRAEKIIRNRLHPQHNDLVASSAGDVRGPSGLLRKNPHKIGFIGPNGLKRIDRLKGNSVLTGKLNRTSTAIKDERTIHLIENPDFYIVVVADMVGGRLTEHDKDCLGQAHKLVQAHSTENKSGAVLAVCFGTSKETNFDTAGVDRLILLEDEAFQGYCPEQQLAALELIENLYQPKHWLFPDSIHGGADLGSRLAARLGERPAVQAWQVDSETTVCPASGGSQDALRKTPRIILLAEECAAQIDETRHEAKRVDLENIVFITPQLEDLGQVEVDANAVALAEAEFILSAGNGVTNWPQFHEAAAELGATEGASRVVVDAGLMPRQRQVGASGVWVTARVYIAVGISGAIQHLQGIGPCEKVIAINTDAGCDMVKRAALSAIGDSDAILQALIERVKAHRSAAKAEEDQHAA